MLEALKALVKEIVEDDEFYKLKAQAYKKAFDELVAVGFTTSQAMQIISAQGVGLKQS